jgi:hypothetical protein
MYKIFLISSQLGLLQNTLAKQFIWQTPFLFLLPFHTDRQSGPTLLSNSTDILVLNRSPEVSGAIFTLSIAFYSKSIQKRVRYFFPTGTLPPSFLFSCK